MKLLWGYFDAMNINELKIILTNFKPSRKRFNFFLTWGKANINSTWTGLISMI